MKEKKTRNFLLWRQPLFFAVVVLVAVTSTAIFALLMSLTPLKNQATSSHLPRSPASITGIIPSTLEHPVNILFLGIDNSGHPHKNHFTPAEALAGNSDTMLLVRLLPETHQINVLSIPRDTLVQMSGVGTDKINDANVRGGPKLAAEVVSQLLNGITIDRYVRVDTEGFIHLVDALGGVEVTVPKQMNYIDKTQNLSIHFSPGRQKLNGQHLQEYVRFRHDNLGDIGRVQRQQEVLKEIMHTLLQPGVIAKLPQILQVVKDNVDADLSLEEMVAVAQTLMTSDSPSPIGDAARSLLPRSGTETLRDRHRLNFIMLPGRFSRRSEYRLSYWISNPKATDSILSRYFDVKTATAREDNINLTQTQRLKIAVENTTGKPGSGEAVVTLLRRRGFKNVYITNHETHTSADSTQKTQVIAQHGNPEAADAVRSTLGIGSVQVASVGDIYSDVTIVVGTDFIERH